MMPLLKDEVESSPYQIVVRVRPPLAILQTAANSKKASDNNPARENVNSSNVSVPENELTYVSGSLLHTVVAVGDDHRTLHVSCDPVDDTSFATFRYGRVFGETTRQSSFYSKAVRPLLDVVLDSTALRMHGTILVTGPPKSGKAYSAWGSLNPRDLGNWGAVPRLVSDLLLYTHQKRSRKLAFSLHMSCCYLHGDNVLSDALDAKRMVRNLRIRDSSSSSVSVAGHEEIDVPDLTRVTVDDPVQSMHMLKKALTALPANHQCVIVTLYLEAVEVGHKKRLRKIHVVKMQTIRESAKALAAFSHVSYALFHQSFASAVQAASSVSSSGFSSSYPSMASDFGPQPAPHVPPYRDSKMTHFLKDALQPDHPVLVVTTVGPEEEYRAATVASIRYAHRLFASQLAALVQYLNSTTIGARPAVDESWTLWSVAPVRKATSETDNPVKQQRWSLRPLGANEARHVPHDESDKRHNVSKSPAIFKRRGRTVATTVSASSSSVENVRTGSSSDERYASSRSATQQQNVMYESDSSSSAADALPSPVAKRPPLLNQSAQSNQSFSTSGSLPPRSASTPRSRPPTAPKVQLIVTQHTSLREQQPSPDDDMEDQPSPVYVTTTAGPVSDDLASKEHAHHHDVDEHLPEQSSPEETPSAQINGSTAHLPSVESEARPTGFDGSLSSDRMRLLYLDLQAAYQRQAEEKVAMEAELVRLREGYITAKESAEEAQHNYDDLAGAYDDERKSHAQQEKTLRQEAAQTHTQLLTAERRLTDVSERAQILEKHVGDLSDLLAVARGEKDRWRQESVSLATQHSQFLAECAGHEVVGQLVQQVRSLSTETLQSMRDCVPDDVVARVFPTLASSVDRDRLLDEEDLEARDFVRQVKLLVRSRSQSSAMLKAITSFCLRAERRVVHRLLNDFRMIVSDANRRSAASSLEEKRLRERLAELEDERKAVLMASADAKMRSVQLEQSMSDRDHQVSALRKALSDARIEAEEAKRVAEDVAALKDALTEKTTTCHSAVERVRGLEFELRETCVENDALRRKVAELENRCMEAETQQIKLRKDMDVLQLGAAALEKEYRESREEIANLYGERERTQREIAELLSVVHGEV